MISLISLRVAIIATDGVEESELLEPMHALKAAGAKVELLSPSEGRVGNKIQAFRHDEKTITVNVDRKLEDAKPAEYDALMLPGGALNSDRLRTNPRVQTFVRELHEAGRPIAAICHAPWVLVSSGVVRGRTLTSYPTIQDDIRNAGGRWVDDEVVVDNSWVTSRQPSDLEAFNREMIQVFARGTSSSVIQVAESA